jgi:hypothetical protein
MTGQTLIATPEARAAVLSRTASRPSGRLRLTAKALKVAVVLDPTALAAFEVPLGTAHFRSPSTPPAGMFNAKSLRRAIATIREHGIDQVAAIVQGKLAAGDVLEEAGLAAQLKGPRPLSLEPPAAAQ